MGRVGSWRCGRAIGIALMLAFVWLGASLLPSGTQRISAQSVGVRVPILAYHAIDYSYSGYSVTPEQLDAECAWLVQNGYTVVSIWQFWNAAFGSDALPASRRRRS